jgi:hypothetical protein
MKNGIEEAGMQWLEIPQLDWAAGLVPYENDPALQTWKARAWEQTLSYIKANKEYIDIFLCYLYPKQIDISAIQQIRELGIPCINFYCDNVRSFKNIPKEFKVFDLVWVPEFEAVDMYKKTGVAYVNLPMPIWVDPKYRIFPDEEKNIISFIGSKDYLREQLLAEVIDKGLQLQIRGNGWNETDDEKIIPNPSGLSSKIVNQIKLFRSSGITGFTAYHLNRYKKTPSAHIPVENILTKPDFEEYISITRESCITRGINRVPILKASNKNIVTYSRLRDLEAPMLGACYITEHTAGLPRLYDIGKEIETYADADELIYKFGEIAASKNKRKELRTKGQEKALAIHSVPQSLHHIKTRIFN